MRQAEVTWPTALLLPGQGAQHRGMASGLYDADEIFAAQLDAFFGHLGEDGTLLRQEWLTAAADSPVDDASRSQPLLFAIDHAIARSLCARGARPEVLLGHSIGELAAAVLADVLDLPAAARMIAARTAATVHAPAGGMLAVGASPVALQSFLDDPDDPAGVVVGAWNAPRQTVLAGPSARLAEVTARVADAGLPHRAVGATLPFHSPALRPAARRLTAAIPIRSARTAALVTDEQAVDPSFWAGQLAEPVLFWPALDALLTDGDHTLMEAGPGQGLTTIAHRHPAVRRGDSIVVTSLSGKDIVPRRSGRGIDT
jgi:acyl transferase domain-containing protein